MPVMNEKGQERAMEVNGYVNEHNTEKSKDILYIQLGKLYILFIMLRYNEPW
jgi:hypothetical protein